VFEGRADHCKLDPCALVNHVLDDGPHPPEDHGGVDDYILEQLFGTAVAAEAGDLLDDGLHHVGLLALGEFVQVEDHLHLAHFVAELG